MFHKSTHGVGPQAPSVASVRLAAREQRAVLGLLATAALWGLTFPLTKVGVGYISPEAMVLGRFVLATVALAPFVAWRAFCNPMMWRYGAILGILNAGLQVLQATSLQTITASRCAFILGSNVLFVPILEQLTGLRRVQMVDVAATLVCLTGLFVLTGGNIADVGPGDFYALLAAFGFALYVIAVTFAGKHRLDYRPLTLMQLAVTTVVSLVLALPTLDAGLVVTWQVVLIVTTCGIGCTLFPVLLQCKYQPALRAHTAALIVTLEPVFAAVLAILFLDEPMTPSIIVGGTLMVLAAFLPQMPHRLRAYARR